MTPDRAGMLLLGLAVATAPLEIWALARVGSHGVTAAHLVAMLACAFAVLRARRVPLTAAFVVYGLLALLAWGVVIAFLQPVDASWLARTARNAALFVLMFGALAGGSTVKVDRAWGGAGMRVGGLADALVVVYAVYQAAARRLSWPLAFLPVTNPTYKTDPLQEGLQYGVTAVANGWGSYFLRASATFSEPSYLGQYLVYGLIVGLASLPLGGRPARLGAVGIGLATVGLIANYSLTGLFTFAVVSAVLAVPLLRQIRPLTLLGIGAAAAALVLLALRALPSIYANLAFRLANLSVASSSGRFDAWPLLGQALRERPWGTGLSLVPFGNDIHSGVALLLLQFGLIGALAPALWLSGIAAGVIVLVGRARALPAGSRAAVTAGTGFLAAQLAGWVVSGEMRHALAWVMSGVAFGTLGRLIEPELFALPLRQQPLPQPHGAAADRAPTG
jgi:hypothetical protein